MTNSFVKCTYHDAVRAIGLMDSHNSGTNKFTCKREACRPKGGSSNEVAWHEVAQVHEKATKKALAECFWLG